jgi:hypothetical protein
MLFGEFIVALEKRGRHAEAERYRKLVAEKFVGTLADKEIDALPVDDLVAILQVARKVKELYCQQPSALQRYVAELQARGFTVTLGEKYRGR